MSSPPHRTIGLRVISCLGVELEAAFLTHFLTHYAGLGVPAGNIHLILNAGRADAPELEAAEAVLAAHGAATPHRWIAPYTSDAMWAERRALQMRVARPGDWILNADADEHHVYPDAPAAIAAYCERKGYNAVQGVMIDRLAADGTLAPVAPAPALTAQFPVAAEMAVALFGRRRSSLDGTVKLMMHRGDVLPSRGGHNPWGEGAAPRFLAGARLATFPGIEDPATRLRFPFRVDHYNWTARRRTSLERRLATPGVSTAGRAFGEQVLDYLTRHGRIRPEDVALGPVRPPTAGWRRRMLALRLAARLRHRFPRPRTTRSKSASARP
ncbi:hypothetical protein [uncultured Jannaschia sp.]|uniref:hypothetical protein n=1 Tax=uncultured Jannaschia sp. TaxID=293347 RepID=UPI0026281D30|nr:hypothetical protein [uncultured Jannaschia sp.]